MSAHLASIRWLLAGDTFTAGRYSREHTWTFDGGLTVPASPSPGIVPAPWSNPAHVDPEEAFVASVASCHMLWWLSLAAKAGCDVRAYADDAVGHLSRNAAGQWWISRVELRPLITYGARAATGAEEAALHEQAHAACFIAHSIRSEVTIVPRSA